MHFFLIGNEIAMPDVFERGKNFIHTIQSVCSDEKWALSGYLFIQYFFVLLWCQELLVELLLSLLCPSGVLFNQESIYGLFCSINSDLS